MVKDTIPKGRRVDIPSVEKLSRLICVLNNQDADRIIKSDINMSLGKEFPLWYLHKRLAQGIVDFGWKPKKGKK